MRSFTDTAGRTWTLEVTFGAYRRLHAAGFDCADILQLEQLTRDPDLAITVLIELCGKQMHERLVSQDEFEAAFDLEVLDQALMAVVEAVIDFFPQPKRRILRDLWEKVHAKAESLTQTQLQQAIKALASEEIDAQIETLFAGRPFASPDSSASTPTPSPSASSPT